VEAPVPTLSCSSSTVRTARTAKQGSFANLATLARQFDASFFLFPSPKDPSVAEEDPRPPALEAVRDKIVDKIVFLITHVLYFKR